MTALETIVLLNEIVCVMAFLINPPIGVHLITTLFAKLLALITASPDNSDWPEIPVAADA
jgi:hypothetical protein